MTFTVRAYPDQAARWAAASALQSGGSVGEWLSKVADAYLCEVTKSGNPLPLTWRRGSFRVLLRPECSTETRAVEVEGRIAGPFGVFRGSSRGLAAPPRVSFSLVHRPSRRIVASLSRRRDCMMLASELLPLRANWDEEDADRVVAGAPDERRVQQVIRLYEKSGE